MPPQLCTVLLCTIILIVLLPISNLLPQASQLSLWLAHTSTSVFAPPLQLKTLNHIRGSKEHELKYHFDNVAYFTPTHSAVQVFPFVPSTKSHLMEQTGYTPLTVVRLPPDEGNINYTMISHIINDYLLSDDVLTPAWLGTLVLVPDHICQEEPPTTSFIDWETLAKLAKEYHVKHVFLDPLYTLVRPIGVQGINVEVRRIMLSPTPYTFTRGPYLGSLQKEPQQLALWPVYRLYSDIYRAFLFGVYKPLPMQEPQSQSQYHAFRELDELGYIQIPVPSRLSSPYSGIGNGPLRMGVKDLYDLKGVPTSAGSRAYGELYGPAIETATCLQLLDPRLGVFVGKTKTAPFATIGLGHHDHVDEQYPFSARGDGWQTCLGSSSGSACAMTAYDWLDVAIGSDTGGSMRMPAGIAGLYGNRPSTGLVPLNGVIPLWGYADTPGLFARDPNIFADLNIAWLSAVNGFQNTTLASASTVDLQFPKSLLIVNDYLKQTNAEAQQVVDVFLKKVQGTLGLTVERVELDDVLEEHGYTEQRIGKLQNDTDAAADWWSWKKVGETFLQDYAASHEGQEPGLDPGPRNVWRRARNSRGPRESWKMYHEVTNRCREFQEWLFTKVLAGDGPHCTNQILVSSLGLGGLPIYRERDLNNGPLKKRTRLWSTDICSFGGCADYTIPIGQVPYLSEISNVMEPQAVTISLIARPGCNLGLLKFIKQLAEAGLIETVKSGRSAF